MVCMWDHWDDLVMFLSRVGIGVVGASVPQSECVEYCWIALGASLRF